MTYYAAPGLTDLKMLPLLLTCPLRLQQAEEIAKVVAKYHGLERIDLNRKCRNSQIVTARQQACYIIRQRLTGISLNQIASIFGTAVNYDHSAVIHCDKTIKNYLAINDLSTVQDIANIKIIL